MPPCAWSTHNYKHFPTKGTTRKDTKVGPAVYLPGTTPTEVRVLESGTARAPDDRDDGEAGKREYLRNMGGVIGWDRGEDASASFVECSGGENAGRSFHGRPMCDASVDQRPWAGAGGGA